MEAQLAKRDKEIAHLKAVNEKQTRNAFASEAEFERKLDAAEAAVKEAKQATREAKEKAAEQEETLKRKIKATKKKVEKERELVEAKDAELVRFTQKLQDVMNLLDAEREEKASLTASTSQTERATEKTAKLEAQLEKAHGQIDGAPKKPGGSHRRRRGTPSSPRRWRRCRKLRRRWSRSQSSRRKRRT